MQKSCGLPDEETDLESEVSLIQDMHASAYQLEGCSQDPKRNTDVLAIVVVCRSYDILDMTIAFV